MRIDYLKLYNEYVLRHTGTPRSFSHFIVVLSSWHHHRNTTRPRIIWWEEARKLTGEPNWKVIYNGYRQL